MARQVNCTGCGAVGTIAPCDNIVFRLRGVYEGKSVVKCTKCGCGLLFNPLSGIFFGKLQLIPDEQWQGMQQQWKHQVGLEERQAAQTADLWQKYKGEKKTSEDVQIDKGQYAVEPLTQFKANTPEFFTHQGDQYYKAGQYESAIESYNKAIALRPKFPEAYNKRGNANIKIGQHDKAIDDYNKAIALNPQYVYAYNNRGNAYDDKGQYDLAIDDYNVAIAHFEGYALAYYNREIAIKHQQKN